MADTNRDTNRDTHRYTHRDTPRSVRRRGVLLWTLLGTTLTGTFTATTLVAATVACAATVQLYGSEPSAGEYGHLFLRITHGSMIVVTVAGQELIRVVVPATKKQ